MNLNQIMSIDEKYYLNTFGQRIPVCFTHGEGMKLYAGDDVYYDFLGGIAVNAVGHSHPLLVEALREQVGKLIHTSSLYYVENQALLAQKMVESTCADRVFFSNSGAEANEAAYKLVRIYFYKMGRPEKNEIISLKNSFHGRTLANVAATGQEKYQRPYKPLPPGFKHVPINDIQALTAALTPGTAAIIIEPVQGESGVHPADREYLRAVRQLCDDRDILLIFDEIQTGMGRTGTLFAYEGYGVEPDIFTAAKALGGGVPIGALCAKGRVAAAFEPGDHGTTFGGNAFSCRAGLAVFEIMEKQSLLENCVRMGEYFAERLRECAGIKELRSRGLMIGADLENMDGRTAQLAMFKKGFLVGAVGGTMRLLPPLIIEKADIDLFIGELKGVIA